MHGKHMFGLIEDFRSVSNKILIDFTRFKKWVNSKLTNRRMKLKNERMMQDDPKRAMLQEALS